MSCQQRLLNKSAAGPARWVRSGVGPRATLPLPAWPQSGAGRGCGVIAMAMAESPAGIGVPAVLVAVLIGMTVFEPPSAT